MPARGRGKATGRRREGRRERKGRRRERGRGRRGGGRRKGAGGRQGRQMTVSEAEPELRLFCSHKPGQKIGPQSRVGGSYSFLSSHLLSLLQEHREENTEDTNNQRAICMGPGQAAKLRKVQKELERLRVSNPGYQSPPWSPTDPG